MIGLRAEPLSLREANAFVRQHHRHHGEVQGHKLAIGAEWNGKLIAVAILGRPVGRNRDDGSTLEALRLCTDGVKRPLGKNRRGQVTFVNAASFLYGRAARIASAMGCRIGTYILEDERGVSVRAAGYLFVEKTAGGTWDRANRRRVDRSPIEPKQLFERGAPFARANS